jgi:soluble lytic murein transglycosylase-like protein
MIVRYALVGLTVAGFASPAAAIDAIPQLNQALNAGRVDSAKTDEIATFFAKDSVTAQKLASLIPPKRTDVLVGHQPASAALMQGSAPVVQLGFIAVEPPRRDAQFAPVGGTVAVVPPFRPSFPNDKPALLAALDSQPAVIAAIEGPSAGFREVLPPVRPSFAADSEPTAPSTINVTAEAPLEALPAAPQPSLISSLFGSFPSTPAPVAAPATVRSGRAGLDSLIASYAKLNGVPENLVHRVVIRESKYNPRAVGRGGALGLMQIKHATARGLGYTGPASGLLDAETNLTYAVKYLAGAYQAAGGDHNRAVAYYARGYYYAAKHQASARTASRRGLRQEAEARVEDTAVLAQTATR